MKEDYRPCGHWNLSLYLCPKQLKSLRWSETYCSCQDVRCKMLCQLKARGGSHRPPCRLPAAAAPAAAAAVVAVPKAMAAPKAMVVRNALQQPPRSQAPGAAAVVAAAAVAAVAVARRSQPSSQQVGQPKPSLALLVARAQAWIALEGLQSLPSLQHRCGELQPVRVQAKLWHPKRQLLQQQPLQHQSVAGRPWGHECIAATPPCGLQALKPGQCLSIRGMHSCASRGSTHQRYKSAMKIS
mmetsp:Transcript_19329/g.35008  ORF Transcript_19329/g.35008 Transcript_19329/m.35008 type:complete len:241 (+) Transcript_19329:229-951(+)